MASTVLGPQTSCIRIKILYLSVNAKSVNKNPRVVVSLDIGSTYSGYAYQFRDDYQTNPRLNIHINSDWGVGGKEFQKTPTCILMDADRKVDSIGFLAEKKYFHKHDENPTGMVGQWYFFKHFKMLLYRQNFNEEVGIDDVEGQLLPFMVVMSKFIRALKDDCIDNLKRSGHDLSLRDIVWVVTVPAIWTDAAKGFMRKAAEQAGIDRHNLVLALEPEAAAIHCMYLSSVEREDLGDLGRIGDTFLVVDLGGGTVDVTAVRVVQDGMLEEIEMADGGYWGGQNINDAFLQICSELFPQGVWKDVCTRNREQLFEMEIDFERAKIEIGRGRHQQAEVIRLRVPDDLRDHLPKMQMSNENAKYFDTKGRNFSFKPELVREKLFEVTLNLVVQKLRELMEKETIKSIEKIVLAGGFAESPIVLERFKTEFPGKRVVSPIGPFYAVMKGAVLYGHNPLIFKSRISRHTYGICSAEYFRVGKDPENLKFRDDYGILRCRERFSVHVRKGQSVALLSRQPTITYVPLRKDLKIGTVAVYSSPQESPQYVTDKGCKLLGEVNINIPNESEAGGKERNFEITTVYGGTELCFEIFDTITKKSVNLDIKYL